MIRFGLLLWTVIIGVSVAEAAPKAALWPRWQVHDPGSRTVVDHRRWNTFLAKYVSSHEDGINRVAYGKVDRAARDRLSGYLKDLQIVLVSGLTRDEQRAFWINLYNALTVKVVLDKYPVTSIRKINISPGFFSSGPWGKKLARIEGEDISLDDIEHRILRPIWKDPRLHYALNCASLGCPNLLLRAFTADNTEALLQQGAVDYINHPRGVRVAKGKLVVSSIYEWFKEDFGGDDEGVIGHLKAYASPDLKTRLQTIKRIDDDHYDWSLNE